MPLGDLAQAKEPARAAALAARRDRRGRGPLAARRRLRPQLDAGVGARRAAHLPGDGERPALLRAARRASIRGPASPMLALVAQAVIVRGVAAERQLRRAVSFAMSRSSRSRRSRSRPSSCCACGAPEAPRAFRVPGYPLVPRLFIVVNVWMLWSVLTFATAARARRSSALAIVAAGVPAYVAFRARSARGYAGEESMKRGVAGGDGARRWRSRALARRTVPAPSASVRRAVGVASASAPAPLPTSAAPPRRSRRPAGRPPPRRPCPSAARGPRLPRSGARHLPRSRRAARRARCRRASTPPSWRGTATSSSRAYDDYRHGWVDVGEALPRGPAPEGPARASSCTPSAAATW